MNKGVVVEKRRRYLIVLTNDGEFHKARPIEHADIGEIVQYERTYSKRQWNIWSFFRLHSLPNQLMGIASALLLFVGLGYLFVFDEEKSHAYITIDINPSVELLVDADLQVKSLNPLNEDGIYLKNLLGFSYEGKQLEEVVDSILSMAIDTDFTENEKNVLIGVSYTQDTIFKRNPVENYIQELFDDSYTDWNMAYIEIPEDIRLLAKEQGTSMMEFIAKELDKSNQKLFNQKFVQAHFTQDIEAMIHLFYNPIRASKDEFHSEISLMREEAQAEQEADSKEESNQPTTKDTVEQSKDSEISPQETVQSPVKNDVTSQKQAPKSTKSQTNNRKKEQPVQQKKTVKNEAANNQSPKQKNNQNQANHNRKHQKNNQSQQRNNGNQSDKEKHNKQNNEHKNTKASNSNKKQDHQNNKNKYKNKDKQNKNKNR